MYEGCWYGGRGSFLGRIKASAGPYQLARRTRELIDCVLVDAVAVGAEARGVYENSYGDCLVCKNYTIPTWKILKFGGSPGEVRQKSVERGQSDFPNSETVGVLWQIQDIREC